MTTRFDESYATGDMFQLINQNGGDSTEIRIAHIIAWSIEHGEKVIRLRDGVEEFDSVLVLNLSSGHTLIFIAETSIAMDADDALFEAIARPSQTKEAING